MPSSPVERWIDELARDYRRRRLAAALARGTVAVAVLVTSVAIALPGFELVVLGVAASLLALVGLAIVACVELDPVEADRRLGLRGRLRTWLDARSAGRSGPMVGWLERELAAGFAAAPPLARRNLGRRGLGAARSALVLLAVLWLLRWLVLPPLPDGVIALASRPTEPVPTLAETSEAKPPVEPADREPSPRAATERPDPDADEQPPRQPDFVLPPEALVFEPPVQDTFVVPSFVGSAGGREVDGPAAGLDEGPAGRAAAGSGARNGAADDREQPPSPAQEFERAAEAALRSRHVPPAERAFVRRWFRSLQEERR